MKLNNGDKVKLTKNGSKKYHDFKGLIGKVYNIDKKQSDEPISLNFNGKYIYIKEEYLEKVSRENDEKGVLDCYSFEEKP